MEFKTFFLYFLTSYFLCNLLFGILTIGLEQIQLYVLKKKLKNSGLEFLTLDDLLEDNKINDLTNKRKWN